jgi:hypothetical protein
MDERYGTGRTLQTSINNQHKQSKARHKLDCTLSRYKELNTGTDSRPKQHKHYIKRKLTTAIAIIIMIIDTASSAANDIVTTTYETYNKEQQLSKEDTVNRIKAATTKEPQNRTQEAYTTHTKTKDKDEETRQNRKQKRRKIRNREGAETNLCHSPTNRKLQAGKGTLPESAANTHKMAKTRRAQGQGRTRGTKSRA